MAYNTEIETSIDALYEDKDIDKRKMFGGVGYKIHGNMCFGILGDDIILRMTKESADKLISKGKAKPFSAPGRKPMKGWATVGREQLNDEDFEEYLQMSFDFTKTIAPK